MIKDSFLKNPPVIQTSNALYFDAVDDFGSKIFIQSTTNSIPTLDELLAIKNDYEISSNLHCDGVLKSRELIRRPNGIAIIKDYFEGITLSQYLKEHRLTIVEFLKLGIRLSQIVAQLHSNKIIHKDLNPENILISHDGRNLIICNSGIASQLAQEKQELILNESLKGSLPHISPEQTGRMNRSIDYRSDLYSLGITLYQAICGKLPFQYKEDIELIHAHIARYPVEPHKRDTSIPETLSAIIMKLLAKNAEDRYQSASGLEADLSECLEQYISRGSIEKFTIAAKDFSPVLSISEKLYGRKEEITNLFEAFELSKNNPVELMLVAGYSGIGKTMLINEIDKPIAARNGYFTTGKFDQYNRDTPYTAFSQAFGSLIRQFLSESDEKTQRWKDVISEKLQGEGQVLIDVIPELELLIGKQPPVLKIGLNESNIRFGDLFQKFLEVLSSSEQPLVIFVDDLQWADSGSFDLLHKIMANPILRNVLMIGAYRDNEVNPSHPLMLLLEKIEKDSPGRTKTITLQELNRNEVNQLVADSLRHNHENCLELTGLIMNKTRGNPFFIKQFIKKLEYEKLLYFDTKWIWDSEGISRMNLTDNVVDLLVSKIQILSDEAKNILELASCIGNSFDIKTLSIISHKPENTLSEILWEIVKEGFVNPRNKWSKHAKDDLWKEFGLDETSNSYDFFHFQHDRIQQAAYSLIPEAEQKSTHLKIGRLLLDNLKDGNLFETLNHLNFAIDLIKDPDERVLIAELNLKAGEKAKRSNAYQPALTFLKSGMMLIEEDQTSDLFKKILIACSETEYLCGNHGESEKLFDKALENAKSSIEKASVLADKMTLYENTNRQLEAIKIALQGLKHVGITLPEKPNTPNILLELLKVKTILRSKKIDDLKEKQNMEKAEMLIAMKILVNLWGPAYLYNQNLLALAILRMVILSNKHGNCAESALAYAFYGFVCCAQLKDYKQGHEYAKLGMWLNEKFEDKKLRSKVYVIYAGCVAFWTSEYSSLLDTLYKAHEKGLESNDLIYTGYSFSFYGVTKLIKGDNLNETKNMVDRFIHFSHQIQYPLCLHHLMALGRALYTLTNTKPPKSVFRDSVDLDAHLKLMEEIIAKDGTYLFLTSHHIYQGLVHTHLSEYHKAISHFSSIGKNLESVKGTANEILFDFYYTLSLLAIGNDGSKLSAKQKRFVQSKIKHLKTLKSIFPKNFTTLHVLLEAENSFWKGKIPEAGKLFGEARSSAKESGFIQILALANERSANFYFKTGAPDLAEPLLQNAYKNYREWGAEAKLLQMKKEFDQIDFQEENAFQMNEIKADTSSNSLDLQSIFKASTTISGEIIFERLVEKLLRIIVENAGAQKVFLIMNTNGKLVAEAFANYEEEQVHLLNGQNLEEVDNIAQSIVQLVFHTGETVILNDATADSRFFKDSYIQQQKPKSVLCLPIKQYGETTAILYLENNIAQGVFTPARLELLNLLSGQMAISLENSLLYEKLEQKVIERTATIENQKMEIQSEKEKSDTLLLNILPFEIAEELKKNGNYKPRKYKNVTIMFTDFEGFTRLSEKLNAEELVEMIDQYYKAYDLITTKYNVEKIKTIGDAYMCVSGLPVESSQHGINAIRTAIEMMDFTNKLNIERKSKNLPYCELRIGIHSGPVAAGVVGSKKFAYDIWGDSVNVAARIESAAEAGTINISSSTYEIIKGDFECVHRGKVDVKNKGKIDMYFIKT